jgi:hypothetical protein
MPALNKLTGRRFLLFAAVLGLVAGCAGSSPTIDTSDEADMTFDGLYPVKGGTADQAWARPGADISQYSKIMLQGVGIEYRPGGESGRFSYGRAGTDHYEISDAQKQRLRSVVRDAFLDELAQSEYFSLVTEPGPDVLLIRGALHDVVSYVPPEPLGRGEIFLSKVGEATLVLEIRDSVSEAIIARAVDRRAAEDALGMRASNRVNNLSEVKRLARTWGSLLRKRLDTFAEPKE